jgi:hypothetical protein
MIEDFKTNSSCETLDSEWRIWQSFAFGDRRLLPSVSGIYSTFRWGGDRRPIENHYLANIPKIEVSFIDMKSKVLNNPTRLFPVF